MVILIVNFQGDAEVGNPEELLGRYSTLSEWSDALAEAGAERVTVVQRFRRNTSMRRGRVDIRLEHTRLEEIVERLVRGILTAALFLGSAQLLASATPPLVYGTSVAGAAGCVLAVVLGWRLLRAKPPPHLGEPEYVVTRDRLLEMLGTIALDRAREANRLGGHVVVVGIDAKRHRFADGLTHRGDAREDRLPECITVAQALLAGAP